MNAPKEYDVVAVGFACVDNQISCSDDLLAAHGLNKGGLVRTDIGAVEKLLSAAGNPVKTTGGAAVNVAAGIARRGGRAGLNAAIANDEAGRFFTGRIRDIGVDFRPAIQDGAATRFVAVVTTPDAERSFAVSGSVALTPAALDRRAIGQAKIVYVDGYLWAVPSEREAAFEAARIAREQGSRVLLGLNDAALIAANRRDYLGFIDGFADILIGNLGEISALFGTEDFSAIAAEVHKRPNLVAGITADARGAHVLAGGKTVHIPPLPGVTILDSSGMGDQFAAGMAYGLSCGQTPEEAARIGTVWAVDVGQHRGAEPRPQDEGRRLSQA